MPTFSSNLKSSLVAVYCDQGVWPTGREAVEHMLTVHRQLWQRVNAHTVNTGRWTSSMCSGCPEALESLGAPESAIALLQAYPLQTYSQLGPTGPPGGAPITRWQLRNNLQPEAHHAHR